MVALPLRFARFALRGLQLSRELRLSSSFSVSTARNSAVARWEGKRSWALGMRPIGREGARCVCEELGKTLRCERSVKAAVRVATATAAAMSAVEVVAATQ